MTNREWLESIGIPDSLVRCDKKDDDRCAVMLRIAYDKQPWQTKKSIQIAVTPFRVHEALSLAGWLNREYDRSLIFVGDDIIKSWIQSEKTVTRKDGPNADRKWEKVRI